MWTRQNLHSINTYTDNREREDSDRESAHMLTEIIQTALAPVFLLVATASVMNVIAGRLARVVDRSRALIDRHPETTGVMRQRSSDELRDLNKRMMIINWSIGLCVACGIVVCIMVPMLFLFGAGNEALETPIAASFIVALLLLLAALLLFLWEARRATRSIRIPDDYFDAEH